MIGKETASIGEHSKRDGRGGKTSKLACCFVVKKSGLISIENTN